MHLPGVSKIDLNFACDSYNLFTSIKKNQMQIGSILNAKGSIEIYKMHYARNLQTIQINKGGVRYVRGSLQLYTPAHPYLV